MANIYRIIARILPRKIRDKFKDFLFYTSIKVNPDMFIGFVILTSILLGLVGGFFLTPFVKLSFWIVFVAFVLLSIIIVYVWLVLLVDKKARLVEDSLPDALQLMASNLRAGMTPDKALLLSSRPEFGPLKDEIDLVGKKVALGKNIGTALMEMAKQIRSQKLVRAVELINSGLDSGGSLATLLEATANDLREQFLIDKKIKASISMYVIFIFSAAAMITPVLFGLSSFLIDILQSTLSNIDIPTTAISSLPIKGVQVTISSKFVVMYIITFLVVNSLMASLLLGMIAKGNRKEGLRYYIPMLLFAIPIFLLIRITIKSAMSGLFNF